MKKLMTLLAVAALVGMISAAQAKDISPRVLTFTLSEVGGNVVAAVTGSLNTSALTADMDSQNSGFLMPVFGVVIVGPTQNQSGWRGFTSSTSAFGLGDACGTNITTGDTVAVSLSSTLVWVSPSYVSGSALSGTATWNGKNFATMGITRGTYTMTYNGGTDSVVINAGGGSAVPEPGTILAALSILGPAGVMFKRRKA